MNTPAHLLIGAALFGRPVTSSVLFAAFLGAALPDLSLYLMAGTALFVLQIPPQVVFGELYYSDAWQTIFAIDNSVLVWGAACCIAVWRRSAWAIALTGAGLSHLALDFPLHHDDGRPHFWPVSSWVFESPISYWDRGHGATWIAPIEGVAALGATLVLWVRKVPMWARLFAILLLTAQFWVLFQWIFVFPSG